MIRHTGIGAIADEIRETEDRENLMDWQDIVLDDIIRHEYREDY